MEQSSLSNLENILIVRTDRIGDVVLTTPVIKALREAYPKARITMLVAFATRELVQNHPLLDQVIVDDRKVDHKGVFGFQKLVGRLRQENFDSAFIFHTKRRTNLACYLAGIPIRIGYSNNKYGFLLTHGLQDERHTGQKHEMEYCLDVLKQGGIDAQKSSLQIATQDYAEQWASQWIAENGIEPKDRLVAIHPGASSPTKCWPTKQFAQLIDILREQFRCKIVLVGTRNNHDLAFDILTHVNHEVLDLTGAITVAQLVSVLKRCTMMVSNDSGPVHIGAAVGIPVISLFLRNQPGINPERWRPLGEQGFVLCNQEGEEILLNTDGSIKSGRLDSISVDEVIALTHVILT